MKEGITEVFKKENSMEWVLRVNGIKARVEELIINDLLQKNRFNFMKSEKCDTIYDDTMKLGKIMH